MTANESVTTWIARLREGDEDAAERIWQRYFEELVAVAKRCRKGMPARMEDEEDAVLSALNSFMADLQRDRFPKLADRDSLWALLVTITRRKVTRQLERQNAAKRKADDLRGDSAFAFEQAPDPTPDYVFALKDQVNQLFRALGDDLTRQIAKLKLMEFKNTDIAKQLSVSKSTVERKLRLIRSEWLAIEGEAS